MFGRKNSFRSLEIAFYKEAAYHGQHGTINASSRQHDLKHADISFAFKGMTEIPNLTPDLLVALWEEARAQGFVPHHLVSYGRVLVKKEEPSVGSGYAGPVVMSPPLGQLRPQPYDGRAGTAGNPTPMMNTTSGVANDYFPQSTGVATTQAIQTTGQFSFADSVQMKAPALANSLINYTFVPSNDLPVDKVTWKGSGVLYVNGVIDGKEQVGYNVFNILNHADVAIVFPSDRYITARSVLSMLENIKPLENLSEGQKAVMEFVSDVARNDLTSEERKEFDRLCDELVEAAVV